MNDSQKSHLKADLDLHTHTMIFSGRLLTVLKRIMMLCVWATYHKPFSFESIDVPDDRVLCVNRDGESILV